MNYLGNVGPIFAKAIDELHKESLIVLAKRICEKFVEFGPNSALPNIGIIAEFRRQFVPKK